MVKNRVSKKKNGSFIPTINVVNIPVIKTVCILRGIC